MQGEAERALCRFDSDQSDEGSIAEAREDPCPKEMGFCRRLKDLAPRLELLGFTLEAAKAEYLNAVEAQRDERTGRTAILLGTEPRWAADSSGRRARARSAQRTEGDCRHRG